MPQIVFVNDVQEDLAIAGHTANDMVRQVCHRHLAVNRRPAKAAEVFPRSLDDVVASHVNRAVDVAALQLQTETIFANDVGLQQLQVAAGILVVAFQITGSVAQITQ